MRNTLAYAHLLLTENKGEGSLYAFIVALILVSHCAPSTYVVSYNV